MSSNDIINEGELITELRSGSEMGFGILYRRWVSRLYQFVFHYIKSESETDDIVQETFLRVWNNRQTLDPEKSFKSYLFTISYHLLLKELRRQLNNPLMEDYIEYENEKMTLEAEAERNLSFDQFAKALASSKRRLSPRQRQIFEMNKEEELSIQEISQRLNITEQVVRNQLSAALKIIRNDLSQYSCLLLLFLYGW